MLLTGHGADAYPEVREEAADEACHGSGGKRWPSRSGGMESRNQICRRNNSEDVPQSGLGQ